MFTAHTIGENEIVHHGPQTWVWVYRASMGAFPYPGQYEAAGKKLRGGGGVCRTWGLRGGCFVVVPTLPDHCRRCHLATRGLCCFSLSLAYSPFACPSRNRITRLSPPISLSLSRITHAQERPCLTSHGPRLPPLPQPCLPPPKWVQQTHRRTLRQSVQDRRQSQHGPRYHGHQVIAVLSLQRCSFQ